MAKSDREKAQRGPENLPEPHVVDPDEVVLPGADDEAGVGASAAGPELSVSADELTLATPELAPAVIGKDAAETVALEETAEETRAAEEDAAEAGVLAAGPLPASAPAVQAAPSGTAPAGGPAGDAGGTAGDPADAPDGPAAGVQGAAPRPGAADLAGSSEDATETDGYGTSTGAAGEAPSLVLSAAGGPGLHAGTDPAAVGVSPAAPTAGTGPRGRTGSSAVSPGPREALPSPVSGAPAAAPVSVPARSPWAPAGDAAPPIGPRRARSRERQETKSRPLVPLVLGAVVVLALLIWGIVSVVRGLGGGADPQTVQIPTAAGADGVIAENVAPSVLTAGQCLLDFTGISNEVTIVTCTTPHRAQLIASEFYPAGAQFPGGDQLGARAKAACDAADINTDAAAGAGRIELLHVTPTEGTWADDDRRVDCFAVVEEGATLNRSLLNE